MFFFNFINPTLFIKHLISYFGTCDPWCQQHCFSHIKISLSRFKIPLSDDGGGGSTNTFWSPLGVYDHHLKVMPYNEVIKVT
jgi:hypothetical protein